MSSRADSSHKKNETLERLRRKQREKNSHSPSPVLSSSASGLSRQWQPPAQSRDGTQQSRYFPTAPTARKPDATILVPDSSPLKPPPEQQSYRPYSESQSRDVAASKSSSRPLQRFDPLTAPTKYTNGSHAFLSSSSSSVVHDDPRNDDGPPRKRQNRGPSPAPIIISSSPDSPGIVKAGQRRTAQNTSPAAASQSSDDLPEPSSILGSTSNSRLVRKDETPPSRPKDPFQEEPFLKFKISYPIDPIQRIQAAWMKAHGSVNLANKLMADNSWDYKTQHRPPQSNGKVTASNDLSKQRAKEKELGKKSMIYANRGVLETKLASSSSTAPSTPPPKSSVVDLTASSPAASPAVAVPKRKRIQKVITESDESGLEQSEDEDGRQIKRSRPDSDTLQVLNYFNNRNADALQELTGCTPEQAAAIINLRPFQSIDDLNDKLGQGKKKAGPAGISARLVSDCKDIFKGYGTVDGILAECEEIGADLRSIIASWTSSSKGKEKAPALEEADDGALSLRSLGPAKDHKPKGYLTSQPKLLAKGIQLKEYQLLGVNWLSLLYRKNLSCILADEMGLGKTIQVISFFAYLKERGSKGPHLVVVPSSTLENWCREFDRFAPSISVQTYYASKDERSHLRQMLWDTQRHRSKKGEGWDVLITTYNLAQGDNDRKFFRKIDWDCCVFDEGHILKNFQSQRYRSLLRVESKWRLLLTGTPLQNNLQELVSLMNFILPDQFTDAMEDLRAIFRAKGDSKVTLLAQERVSRAKKMMTPFVLRRRKDQVLGDLPKKTERIEWCDMSPLQKQIYRDALKRSRKTVLENEPPKEEPEANGKKPKKTRANTKMKDKVYSENSANVLMDLRKAACHPMLFRTLFTDEILTRITKQLLKLPDYKKRGALFELVKEDMTVMTDSELQHFCGTYESTQKFQQDNDCFINSGKIQTLLKLIEGYRKEGRKMLVFSQFTQVLDILQAILNDKDIQHLVLTGSTPVDARQSLVDEFTEDESIPVFLLSTKAGGMGINLTAASVVIMFDQDFNPHNDRQAQDRAYRIGQKRDVDVVKLITRGTIEEDMLKLGQTKLALDEAVAGEADTDEKGESAPEKEMKMSLMNVLRQQFEKGGGNESGAVSPAHSVSS